MNDEKELKEHLDTIANRGDYALHRSLILILKIARGKANVSMARRPNKASDSGNRSNK